MKVLFRAWFFAAVMILSTVCHCWAAADVGGLRCEYLNNPLGIDIVKPRLSWIMESDERGQRQTAYQVLVASTPELLAKDQGDLWDSGRVESDRTIHVEYAGKPLVSKQRCHWKVRLWDKNGKSLAWSQPALWTMGLLKDSDWGAPWISASAQASPPRLPPHNGYHSQFATSADVKKWVSVDLGKVSKIDGVQLHPARPYDLPTDTPGFLFPVRFKIETALKSDFSDAKVVVDRTAADFANPGTEAPVFRFDPTDAQYVRLSVTRSAAHDEGNFGFALAEMQVFSGDKNVAKGGSVAALDTIDQGGWAKRKLVDGRLLSEKGEEPVEPPSTMLRKDFDVRGPIKRATVWATGLGLYELSLNGQRVGDHILAPEWTCFKDRVQYQTYDVTELLRSGKNAVGAMLGGGWWTGPLFTMPIVENPHLYFRMRMDVELDDGSTQTIVTDPSWQATTDGPIRRSGIYYGEMYDFSKEMPGWNKPEFSAKGWSNAVAAASPKGAEKAVLVAQRNEPIRVVKELRPVKITEPKPGVYIFDMGQNMVGWCRLTVDVPAGTKIIMRHAEMLKDDGTLFVDNLGGAQIDTITWAGGKASFEPHFTYHGFRYVEVSGLPTRPNEDAIVGRVFHSDSPEKGRFESSNELLGKIMHCVEWVQRGNMHSVPTDCPQRTERMGWMGDIQAFAQTAIFNRDMAGFLSKWLVDVRDSQADDGRYPDVAPHVADPNKEFSGVPAWGDAGTIVPWRVYQNYADVRLLEQHFDSACRWVDFIQRNNPNLLWQKNRGNDYNDWLNGDWLQMAEFPDKTGAIPNEVFATAFFAHSAENVAKMAKVIGRTEDAAKYGKLFEDIKAAFNREYVSPTDGRIKGDTQAGYALALQFNLLDESLRPKAAERMIEALRKYKDHPSTGIQTTHRLMLELSRNGYHDEACRLINLRTVPSWGFMVEMGATTIWERWDGYVKGRGFKNSGMNSFNHWAFGAVGEWVWRELAGINPDEAHPGFKHFLIRPRPGKGFEWVKARYDSIRGLIASEWKLDGDRFSLNVTIPANTTATVYVPAKDAESVTESGEPATKAVGVKFLRMEDGAAVFAVESGRYSFVGRK